MMSVEDVNAAPLLNELVGLQLSVAHHAGNMRGFHFGKVVRDEEGIFAEYALHIQCPWRIEGETAILTGFHDWYTFVGEANLSGARWDPDSWDPATGGSLQEQRLRALFGCPVDGDRPILNRTNKLFVTSVQSEVHGGCRISLDSVLTIVLFPCSSEGECWRLFRPGDDWTRHLVVGDLGTPAP